MKVKSIDGTVYSSIGFGRSSGEGVWLRVVVRGGSGDISDWDATGWVVSVWSCKSTQSKQPSTMSIA